MSDSEKSYGYSEDIYHGQRAEKSYEYGSDKDESEGAEGQELSPEEKAMRIEGPLSEVSESAPDTPGYDYGRDGTVESFTWENSEEKQEAQQGGKTRAPTPAR